MSFKRFLNSHFVFGNEKHISFFQGSSFRFAVIRCISHQRLKSSFNFYEVQPTFGCTSFKHTVELVYLSRDQRLNLLLFWQCLALFFSSSWPVAP